jgi:hypothetical protein
MLLIILLLKLLTASTVLSAMEPCDFLCRADLLSCTVQIHYRAPCRFLPAETAASLQDMLSLGVEYSE